MRISDWSSDVCSSELLALGKETSAVDGVRVQEACGWWLLRASNTQDILVVRCEARSTQDLEAITECVRRELAAAQILLPPLSGGATARRCRPWRRTAPAGPGR